MLVSLGRRDMSGNPMLGCPHMAEWLPKFDALGVKNGLVKTNFDIQQAYGLAVASAGTHSAGTCLDFRTRGYSYDWVKSVSKLGLASGMVMFPRGDAGGHIWDSSFIGNPHIHGVLMCPCNPNPAAYQIDSARNGHNGLGDGTRGSYPFAPVPHVDYKSIVKDDDMPLSDQDIQKIVDAVVPKTVETVFNASVNRSGLTLGLVTQKLAQFLGMSK